jgi:serine/threonine protein kinase
MADRYRPLYKLDSGGMAEVYVAEAESLGGFKKKVAIKRILPGLLKDERFVRMFLDEARLSLHLNHANIVSVFDLGKSENTYFIVMEYVEGTNLKSLLDRASKAGSVVPVPLTVWTLNEVLKGLDYAHNLMDSDGLRPLGVVHRDVSPPNILVSWNGEVKLTDFGLAKATMNLESTDPGVVKGKFSYLAPEAAHGRPVDARADIFAVGILAYEMLTGRRLFLGETDYQTVELVRRAQIPSMRALNPLVSEELEGIVGKALAREPEERYQTANEFADDLLGFLFSHSLKFGARDLSAFLKPIRASKPDPQSMAGPTNLILELIDDELLKFRSLDSSGNSPAPKAAGQGDDTVGAAPLAIEDFATTSAEHSPVPSVLPSELPRLVESTQPIEVEATKAPSGPSPAPRAESGGAGKWIFLLLLLAAGGGAYYWLMVLGNLEKLSG